MPYLDLAGVRSYHEITGTGAPLVLLHGGGCTIETMRPIAEALAVTHRVHAVERPGHGRTPDRGEPFGYDVMLADTLAYLDAVGLRSAHVLGFSDGAIIGLLLARDHPHRVRSLIAISANLDPGGFVTGEGRPDPGWAAAAAQVEAEYAALSPDGAAHAAVVENRLMTLWTTEPRIDPASLGAVRAPTLVLAGERDSIAPAHTLGIARAIPGARVGVVPDVGHLLVVERPDLVARLAGDFLADLPPAAGPR